MPGPRVPSQSPYAASIGFSAAARAGDWVTVAGTTAVAPDGSIVGEGDAYAQAQEVFRKVTEALRAAGAAPEDVVHTRMYVAAPEHWAAVGRAHGEAVGSARPTATMVVCGLLDPRMLVEVEAVAYTGPESASS